MTSRDGWQRIAFGEMAENITARVDDPSQAGVDRYVGLEHLDPDSLSISRWGQPSDVEATKLRFWPGDIIFGRRRAYQRKLAVADFEGICSAHALVLRAKPAVALPEFLPVFMQSEAFFERALAISVGSLSPTINWRTLKDQEFSLPPIEEQREIAALLWAVEIKRRATDRLLAAAVVVRGSVVSLGAESSNATVRLGDVGDVSYGVTLNSRRTELPVSRPYLRVANVYRGSFDLDEIKLVRCSDKESSTYSLAAGDILVVEGHASMTEVGRAALWLGEIDGCLHQNHLIRVRVHDGFDPRVVAELLNSPMGRSYFRSRAKSTSGLSTINSTVVKEFPLPVLEAPKLLEMVNKLEAVDSLATSLQRLRQSESALQGQLAGSLIGVRR